MASGETAQISSFLIAVSAAIGAVVASAFSTVAILVNGVLERKSRRGEAALERQSREEEAARERSVNRKQLLMQEAGRLADWRLGIAMKQSDISHQPATLTDPIVLMESYYNFLTHLWEHGKLPDDPKIER